MTDRGIRTVDWLWLLMAALFTVAPVSAWADDEDDPTEVDLVLLEDDEEITGKFVNADDERVVLNIDGQNRTFAVDEINPWSLHELRIYQMALENARIFVEQGRLWLTVPETAAPPSFLQQKADYWFRLARHADSEMDALIQEVIDDPDTPVAIYPEQQDQDDQDDPGADRRRFYEQTPEVQAGVVELVTGWHELLKSRINDNATLLETNHFYILTTWNRRNHSGLKRRCEALYSRLSREFGVPRQENIWQPKLPLLCFWTEHEFQSFLVRGLLMPPRQGVLGLCHSEIGFVFVVLNGPDQRRLTLEEARTEFYATLTHETVHAFNARFLSDFRLPVWYDEGIAEYLSAELVDGCAATQYWRRATMYVRDGRVNVMHNFNDFGRAGYLDYAAMQGLVRYMMHGKKDKFIAFYRLLKSGMSQQDALQEAYGWTQELLVNNWLNSVRGG